MLGFGDLDHQQRRPPGATDGVEVDVETLKCFVVVGSDGTSTGRYESAINAPIDTASNFVIRSAIVHKKGEPRGSPLSDVLCPLLTDVA
jgi:hypothetical protein